MDAQDGFSQEKQPHKNFHGEPSQPLENHVEYMVFILDNDQQRLDVRKSRTQLDSIRKEALEFSRELTKDYIWYREEFQLELKTEPGLIYLHGTTDYGDSLEDEWLIVYILRELSKSHPNLWIRIADSDGEFLLVEAANAIPRWISPEVDHCRVWIHQEKVQIIPSEDGKTPLTKPLTLSQAVDYLRPQDQMDRLFHSKTIDSEAFYRLKKYPKHITDSLHHSLVTIPRKLAYVIHSMPKTIAPAVESFYLRDPISLKPILSPTSSGPSLTFPPDDLVTVSIRFSKVLFAQLKSQRFDPPPSWEKLLANPPAPSPPISPPSIGSAPSKQDMLETGMKLTTGFEILSEKAESSRSRLVRELALVLQDLHEDGDQALPADAEILQSWPDVHRTDNETWMDINYQDFERELQGRTAECTDTTAGPSSSSKEAESSRSFGDAQTQADLRKIVSRFEAFLSDETAGVDGADLETMDFDNDEEGGSGSDSHSDISAEDAEVVFNEEAFSKLLQQMLHPGSAPSTSKASQKAPQGNNALRVPVSVDKDVRNEDESEDEGEDEDQQIQTLSSQMEAELRRHGALTLDPPERQRGKPRALPSGEPSSSRVPPPGKQRAQEESNTIDEMVDDGDEDEDEDEDGEVDIDYNLARNLLESFKSQGGMAGPAGNLMGLMGFQFPRDEDDESGEEA